MRLLGAAVFCCLCISGSCSPVWAATPGELDSDTILGLAQNFSSYFVRVGPIGLWQQIQACYEKASASADMTANCIILDEAGKALDDNRVKAANGTVRNSEWYQDSVFSNRMNEYSQAAFGDPNAYVDFWEKNKKAFGTGLRKLNLQH